LATAWVILRRLEPARNGVVFRTKLGDTLTISREGERLSMDFPARPPVETDHGTAIAEALGGTPEAVLASRDGFAVYASEAEVAALTPNMHLVAQLDHVGIIATAPGDEADFVSRFFAPASGVPEDPVTGSAHCTLIPYWAERLGKSDVFARQISPRGGALWCRHRGERVTIAGHCAPYMRGTVTLPD
jgi:predicted PhzF superfamily epimerase YddE/YHI9